MVTLALTPVLFISCAQEAELENRIASLETKLTSAESTIKVLHGRIEQLEKGSQTEADILRALEGKTFLGVIYGIPHYGYVTTGIKIEYFSDTD
jgi:uncharacterized coiled-coil protein SlyX